MKTVKFHTMACRQIMINYVYNDDRRTVISICIFASNIVIALGCLV